MSAGPPSHPMAAAARQSFFLHPVIRHNHDGVQLRFFEGPIRIGGRAESFEAVRKGRVVS